MRLSLVLSFLLTFIHLPISQASAVNYYRCADTAENASTVVLLKDFFDQESGTHMGQIDVPEWTTTHRASVYRFFLSDQKSFIQIWLHSDIRVDAQMQQGSTNNVFFAKLVVNAKPERTQKNLLCHRQ